MVFPGGLLAQVPTLQHTKTHLFPSTGRAAVIGDFLGPDATFAGLALPFAAVTMDVATARPHVLCEGPCCPPCWRAPPSQASSRRWNSGRSGSTTAAWWPTCRCGRRWPWALAPLSARLQLPRACARPAGDDRRGAVLYRAGDHAHPARPRGAARRRRPAGRLLARPRAAPGVAAGLPAHRRPHRDRLRGSSATWMSLGRACTARPDVMRRRAAASQGRDERKTIAALVADFGLI